MKEIKEGLKKWRIILCVIGRFSNKKQRCKIFLNWFLGLTQFITAGFFNKNRQAYSKVYKERDPRVAKTIL